jgi:ATP-binding cassette subfamily B protein
MEIGGQLARYFAYVARHFRSIYLILLLTVLVLVLEYVATSLMIPIAPGAGGVRARITDFWQGVAAALGLEPSLRLWLWFFLVVMVVRLLFGYVLTILTSWLGKRVHQTLSERIFSHILFAEPISEIYVRSVGHYITLAGDDTFRSGTIVSSMLQSLAGALTALVAMVVLFQFSGTIFTGVVLFLGACLILIAIFLRRMLRVNARAVSLSRELGTTFVEALNSLRSIRSLHSEHFVAATYADQVRRYLRMLVELDALKAGVKALPAIVLLLLAAFLLRPGREAGIADGALFGGTVIVVRIFAALGQMMTSGSQLLTDVRAIRDIGALVSLGDEPGRGAMTVARGGIAEVTLDAVSFGYPGRSQVLEGLSFRFRAGHTYAIVGPSGAGKSTLADLLLGLTHPDDGRILVNGTSLEHIAGRLNIMLVEQQPKIFSSTVRANLLLGADASDRELVSALEIVNLDEMVASLPAGLDTPINYLGENFSGGQRQRLGIARALIRGPDVLILDEATSALDPETRKLVVAKLRQRMGEGIIIFVTHDIEIASLADEVLPIGTISQSTSKVVRSQ